MKLIVGTWDPAWGYTWVERGFGKLYALRSLADGSFLCVDGKEYPTPGKHSCHITLLPSQAVVSDYTSGTLSLYPLGIDGLPAGEPSLLHFEGHGPHPVRQTAPHIHSSWLSPDRKSLIVVDLGTDRIYRFRIADGRIEEDGIEVFHLPDGCGPRHCAFGDGVLYVATELSDEVLVLNWPDMQLKQRIVVNPAMPSGGGHVVLAGKYLYVSSRLENDGIGIFKVLLGGRLEKVGYQRTGAHPRHFCVSGDASLLAVACKDDDRIEFYSIDDSSGLLTPVSGSYAAEKPVYVELV